MRHNTSATKRFVSNLLIAALCAAALSACSPNRTQVSNWWYNQQWESAGVNGDADG